MVAVQLAVSLHIIVPLHLFEGEDGRRFANTLSFSSEYI
jgi:hypothetical protein